ncbi:MAG: alpha/beta hydrolase [Nitriliruptorales bacterium]|nr:alpha/beta hydrolase [Nitriliruptorales bacterium]
MASWQAEVVKRLLVAGVKAQRMRVLGDGGVLTAEASEDDLERYALKLREQLERVANITPLPNWASFESADAHVPGEWVVSERSEDQRVILHLHGGGYFMGSPRTHRGLGAALARTARARVFLPDYRLAPEHRFPAALEDAVHAYRWLLDEAGADPEGIAVSGDSAGGGLAVSLLLEIKREELPMPACYVGMSPWTDLAGTGDSVVARNHRDPWLEGSMIQTAGRGYAGDTPLDHPGVSPLYGDFTGLPPMLVHVGTDEVLYDDGRRLVERAREAGVQADFGPWDGMWHVFHAFPGVPESKWALREIGAFIRRHTGHAHGPTGEGPRAADVDGHHHAA